METTEARPLQRPSRFATRMASGVVALIPLAVTFVILRWLFNLTAGSLLPLLDPLVGEWPAFLQALLAVGILLTVVYLLGEIAAHVVGRRVLALAEAVVLRLPFVKVIYSISKQVVGAFQGQGTKAFKSVVYVDFPLPGHKSVAFVTSHFTKPDGTEWSTIFVPTTPNPTTGFLQIVERSRLEKTEMTVEEGIKMIMSLGVLRPNERTTRQTTQQQTAPPQTTTDMT
ncbi:MAG: DUF502 domain-containing protein [Longimicrobiales bacterium]|nr:DUF502 domain-containing protein [Longimicrobiales bacterium]